MEVEGWRIYSCDLSPNASRFRNFISAPRIEILRSTECPFAGVDAEPLGPCFTSPAEIKQLLDDQPVGHRAISLEGNSMYNLEDENATRYWQDSLGDNTTTAGPWGDLWASVILDRFTVWFANFSAIGGEVDLVMSDFESGGAAYWYSMKDNAEQIAADPRWPTLKTRLNAVGAPFGANFDDISDMPSWSGGAVGFSDWRPYVWDIVVVDRQLGEYLNSSVYEPIRENFSRVSFSNFAHHYHTDASGLSEPAMEDGGWWPWATTSAVSGCGTGSHVGTHQSFSIYGGSPWQNYSQILRSQTAASIAEVSGSSFSAFVQDVKKARDATLAAPKGVALHPWIAPRDFVCGDPGFETSGSWLFGSAMWTEEIFHVGLSTAATTWLWWKPGSQEPEDVGIELASATFDELQGLVHELVGGDDEIKMAPIVDESTGVSDWATSYVLSGAELICGNRSASLYRFTPRCLNIDGGANWCTGPPSGAKNGTAASFKVGSGFSISPVEGGTLVFPPAETSPAGYWIVSSS